MLDLLAPAVFAVVHYFFVFISLSLVALYFSYLIFIFFLFCIFLFPSQMERLAANSVSA